MILLEGTKTGYLLGILFHPLQKFPNVYDARDTVPRPISCVSSRAVTRNT
jgi:hypothetical protein